MKMFSIKDSKAESFNTPFFQATFGLAERAYTDAANDEKNSLSRHKEDFSLWYLGELNQNTGEFIPEYPPKLIAQLS